MSSLHNQPVVDDIVSAFETSQNQSWSIFNNKLGSTPIKDCKKKDIFKSENPIELSDEDIPVFGLVPRLEKLILVSCNKCSMVVKRDCIHHHYNRRHNNSENDNFSLQRFILPTVKINKHKKQKLNNLRKLPEKKIIIGGDIDPVVQTIKTEFDELEYERLKEINQAKIKVENEMQCEDENDVNLEMESCNPSTSYSVFNWNLQSCTQNLVQLPDQKINDKITDCDKNVDKLSPNIKEEFQINTYIKDENISYVTNSSKLLNTLLNSNESPEPNVSIDFSGIVDDNALNNKNDGKSYDELKLINNDEQIKITTNNIYLDVRSDDYVQSDSNPSYKLSTIPVNIKEETQLESNMGSRWISNECSSTATPTINQLSINPILVKEELMFTPNNKHSNDINYKNNDNEIMSHSYKMYDHYQLQNNKEQTQLPPSNPEQLDETYNKSSNHSINHYKSLMNLSNIKKEFRPLISQLNIKKEYQPLTLFLNYKEEYQSLITLSNNKEEFQPNIVKEEYQRPTLSSNIKKKYQPLIPLSSIKKEYQHPTAPLNTKVEYKLPALLPNIKKEYQLPTIPLNLKENYQLSIVKEEYQLPTALPNIKDEYYQPPIVLPNIKEKCNVTSTSMFTDILYNDKDDNSKRVLCQFASKLVNSKKPKMFTQNYNYLNVTSYKNSSDSITRYHKSSVASLNIKEEYQPMTELPCIKKEIQISPNIVHSSIVSNENKNYERNDESRVLNNKTNTTLCLANDNSDVISNNISDNAVDSNSSNLILRIKKETQCLQNNEYTFNINNKTIDNSTISYDQSSITSLGVNEESKSSLMTEHSCNSDNDYCSDDFSDTYFQGANGYHKNGLLYNFPSLTYLNSSNDENEEMFKQIERYKNESYKLLNIKNITILRMKSNHLYNERTQSSDDDYTNDYYEQSRAQSLSNLKKLRGILLSKAKMKDYKYIENYKDDYHRSSFDSSDSSDNEIKSCIHSEVMSFKNFKNSFVINYDELSNLSLYSDSYSSYSNSMCDENSNDSVSSNDQSIFISNSITENTKCTQTSNLILSQMNHKQCINPFTMINELTAYSLDVMDDRTKSTQTYLYFCKNCCRVVADLIDSSYLVNSNVKDCVNSYNAQNAVNNSILISAPAQITENPVDRFTPVSSSVQIVNNIIIPTSTKKHKSVNNNGCNRYFPNISNLSHFQQLFHGLENSNNHFTICYNPIIKNNCQIENNEKIYSLESHIDKSKQIENVLYQTLTNESTCTDKNHVLSRDRLKKTVDEKIVYAKNCNVMSSTQNNIDIKTKKSLKRRLEQVTDNKENQEKNNRWIFGDFKKLKRMKFVKRKFSCSDESDNNDNINE